MVWVVSSGLVVGLISLLNDVHTLNGKVSATGKGSKTEWREFIDQLNECVPILAKLLSIFPLSLSPLHSPSICQRGPFPSLIRVCNECIIYDGPNSFTMVLEILSRFETAQPKRHVVLDFEQNIGCLQSLPYWLSYSEAHKLPACP